VVALCGTVCNQAKVQLSIDQGFVYWVAYEHRHDNWEIPQEELTKQVLEDADRRSEDLMIDDKQDVEQLLIQLERNGCIERPMQYGTQYVVLKETCRSEWD
jgi:hypothetical protein